MAALKGVIFGWDNVLTPLGKLAPHKPVLEECGKLVRFLRKNGVEIVVVSNHSYSITSGDTKTPAKEFFEKAWGVPIDWHLCGPAGGGAGKQSHAGLGAVIAAKGWQPNNVIFIGNQISDMQAAVNNKVLLLTAKWYPDNAETTEYGFHMPSPKCAARFIDVFCLRGNHWYYRIDDGPVQVYALAPLGNYFVESKYYSDDFMANIKDELANDDEFWAKFLSTSLYFSGVYQQVDYIAAYPKHTAGDYQDVLVKPMDTFAKSFNKRYIPDLIHRHTTAMKSQFNRAVVTHNTQLDSIHVLQHPTRIVKGEEKQYAKFPVDAGKTVLMIDDVCTKGMGFEAARLYLAQRDISVVSVALLKARKHDYEALATVTLPNGPFSPNAAVQFTRGKTYDYYQHIIDTKATAELTERLKRYQTWAWPNGI
jgi:hypothetical protein